MCPLLHRPTLGARGTDRSPLLALFPLFHSLQLLTLFFSLVYSFPLLSSFASPHTFFLHCTSHPSLFPLPFLPFYQPLPSSSVCSSLDKLPHLFLSYGSTSSLIRHLASSRTSPTKKNTPHRLSHFLFCILLLLAGDINLNPGPKSMHNLTFSHLNIRSVTCVTSDVNKPAVLQDFIIASNIDILALSETWLSQDAPQSTL